MFNSIIKSVISWAMSRLLTSSTQISLNNWGAIPYIQNVYNVVEVTEGTWRVDAHLFLEVSGKSESDRVVTIPTAYMFDRPEFAFVYLQSMPPLFVNTASKIVVVDRHGENRIWDMNQKIAEQPGVDFQELAKYVLNKNAKEPENVSPASDVKTLLAKMPTVPGNWTVN